MVRVFFHQTTQAPITGVFSGIFLKVQDDFSTALGLLNVFDSELGFTVTAPTHGLISALASGTRLNHQFVSHQKSGVKADTKLADQLRIFLFVTTQGVAELCSAGTGNCTQVGNNLIAAHTNTVVNDGDGVGFLIDLNTNHQLVTALQ